MHTASKAHRAAPVPLMPPSLLQPTAPLRIRCGRNRARAQKPPLEKKTGLLQSPSPLKKLTWVILRSATFSSCFQPSLSELSTFSQIQTFIFPSDFINDREKEEQWVLFVLRRRKRLKALIFLDVLNIGLWFPCHIG